MKKFLKETWEDIKMAIIVTLVIAIPNIAIFIYHNKDGKGSVDRRSRTYYQQQLNKGGNK